VEEDLVAEIAECIEDMLGVETLGSCIKWVFSFPTSRDMGFNEDFTKFHYLSNSSFAVKTS